MRKQPAKSIYAVEDILLLESNDLHIDGKSAVLLSVIQSAVSGLLYENIQLHHMISEMDHTIKVFVSWSMEQHRDRQIIPPPNKE